MRVEARDVSPVVRDVVVELPQEKVDAEVDRMYRELARTAKVPGFRPGKVPRSVLERRFGHDVRLDVATRLVRSTSHEALREAAVDPVADPVVQQIAVSPGAAYTYTMRCEVWPKVNPEGYFDLEAKAPPVVVSDEEVERQLESLRQRRAELRPVEGRTAVAQGDHLSLSYDVFVDDKPVAGAAARDQAVQVGEGAAIPGLEEALVGAEVGKSHEFTLTLPDGIGDKALAGKTARFVATVADIKERVVPALDDDLAKEIMPSLATLDELRADLRKYVERRAKERTDREIDEQLVDQTLVKNPFDVPPSLVDIELESAMREAKMSLSMMGIRPEQLQLDDRKLAIDLRPRAERRARQRVVLSAIGDKESVEVTDEEVEGRIRAHAESTGQALSKVRQGFAKGRARDRLRSQIREEKVLDLMRARARITQVAAEENPAVNPAVDAPSPGA